MQPDIRVQPEDFSQEREVAALRARGGAVGAIVTFTGLVRDLDGEAAVHGLHLEHYPGMTEKSLRKIALEAAARWPLCDVTIIHRIGVLRGAEQIVFVGVSSAHRQAAFGACEFIMDYLKTSAPFWKKSLREDGEFWVEAKASDAAASERWRS
ncbi:MAG: molybdopterin synthase catalytic subunit MoaE [Pseudomonadales bacterium]|jgi:molybdopterin synthase catalytic subunit|nr:molybdopterin synthase catalytic subunit MoaE [Pseudomonadales bacterium]